MLDGEEYSSDSDDCDYVPSDHEGVSEEEHSGEEEDFDALKAEAGEDGIVSDGRKKRVKKKKKQNLSTRKRTGGIKINDEEVPENSNEVCLESEENKQLVQRIKEEEEEKKKEKEKKKADDLWSSFMSDVGTPKRPTPSKSSSSSLASLSSLSKPTASAEKLPKGKETNTATTTPSQKVTITKVYDFAGESIKITKEVDADSKEAKSMKNTEENDKAETDSPSQKSSVLSNIGIKRPSAGGGLGSVLNKINKKPKIGTLEKSRLDWNSFKDEEGISEELQIHNRGKQGYMERKQFLERTDLRQFEIEKGLRKATSKR